MIRQVAVLRHGRGYRKGTLMKAHAELPSLRLRYWDWRLCLAARFDASLSASYFQAQTAFRPEPWLHQVRTWSNTEQAGNPPLRLDCLTRARWCLLISEMECPERNRWHLNMGAGVKLLMRKADWTDDSAQKFR